MKKKTALFLLLVLLVALFAAGCATEFADDPVITPPVDEYVKPEYEIEVDGLDGDDFWQGQEEFAFGIDGTARAKMKFLDEGAVFYFKANDVTPNEKGSDVDQSDRVELFMDPLVNGMGDDGLLQQDDLQFRMAANGEISIWRGQKSKSDSYIWTRTYCYHAYKAVWDKDAGYYSMELYIPYESMGMTEKPDKIAAVFNQVDIITPMVHWETDPGERVAEDMGLPNINYVNFYPVFDSEGKKIVPRPTAAAPAVFDGVFEGENVFRYESADKEHKMIESFIGDEGVFVRVSLDVENATLNSWETDGDYWSAGRTDIRVDMGGEGGDKLDFNDVYVLLRPSNRFVLYEKHNMYDNVFRDISWTNPTEGWVVYADMNGLKYDTPGQTGRVWMCVFVSYDVVGMTEKPSSIRVYDVGEGADTENVPSKWIKMGEGAPTQSPAVINDKTFENAMEFTSENLKHGKIEAVIGDTGVYARIALDVTDALIPSVSSDYWGAFRTDIRVDMGGEGGNLDDNDVYFLILPNGNFVYYRKNPDANAFKDISWGNRALINGCNLDVDMGNLMFDTAGQTGRIWISVYIPYTAVGMTEKPQSIRIYDSENGSEDKPKDWIIFEEGKAPYKESIFDAHTFDSALSYTSADSKHDTTEVVIGDEGVFVRVALNVTDATVPSVSNDYWGAFRTDIRVDMGGEGKLIDDNDVYFLMLPSGSFVYYRKNPDNFTFKDISWSNPAIIDGCELFVDMNGLLFDTAGQTGKIWLCVYVPYTAVGMTEKPDSVRVYDSADGSTENNPYQWVVFTEGQTPAVEPNLTSEKFSDAKSYTSTDIKHPEIQTVIAEHGVYVRVALNVTDATVPSASSDYWGAFRTDIRVDMGGEGGENIDDNDVYFLVLPSGSFVYYRKNPDNFTFKDISWSNPAIIDGCELFVDMNGLLFDTAGQTGRIWVSLFIPYSAVGMTEKPDSVRVYDSADGSTENNPSAWVEFTA